MPVGQRLVMLGQHDYICRNAARLLSENIPGAVLHRIEGAGHMSPLERPDQFNDRLAMFFSGGQAVHYSPFFARDGYYGEFGGAFVPEILHDTLAELRAVYEAVLDTYKAALGLG